MQASVGPHKLSFTKKDIGRFVKESGKVAMRNKEPTKEFKEWLFKEKNWEIKGKGGNRIQFDEGDVKTYKRETGKEPLVNLWPSKGFKHWLQHRYKMSAKPITVNLNPCFRKVLEKKYGDNNFSKAGRKEFKAFFEENHKSLLSMTCAFREEGTKVMTINTPPELIELLEAFVGMNLVCSRSEAIRFILLHNFLMGARE